MQQFENVTVALKGNSYFDGQVTSRTVTFADGSVKTLGFMLPGSYEFGTSQHELMEITSGELEVLLPGETTWKKVVGGEAFEVAANQKFGVNVKSVTDYCCSYSW